MFVSSPLTLHGRPRQSPSVRLGRLLIYEKCGEALNPAQLANQLPERHFQADLERIRGVVSSEPIGQFALVAGCCW